jgi:hypothetical protein
MIDYWLVQEGGMLGKMWLILLIVFSATLYKAPELPGRDAKAYDYMIQHGGQSSIEVEDALCRRYQEMST